MHQILGENILKLRKENGLTQEKLAAILRLENPEENSSGLILFGKYFS